MKLLFYIMFASATVCFAMENDSVAITMPLLEKTHTEKVECTVCSTLNITSQDMTEYLNSFGNLKKTKKTLPQDFKSLSKKFDKKMIKNSELFLYNLSRYSKNHSDKKEVQWELNHLNHHVSKEQWIIAYEPLFLCSRYVSKKAQYILPTLGGGQAIIGIPITYYMCPEKISVVALSSLAEMTAGILAYIVKNLSDQQIERIKNIHTLKKELSNKLKK